MFLTVIMSDIFWKKNKDDKDKKSLLDQAVLNN